MIEWIIENREWVFSGVGVFILAGILGLLKMKKKNENAFVDNSSSVTISGDANISGAVAGVKVREEIEPIWVNITSGQSSLMHPKDMHPEILDLWHNYINGDVDAEGIKIRMKILEPALKAKYAQH